MTWEQLTAVVATVSGAVIAFLGYRRSRHVDKITAQTGAAANGRAGIAQQFEILNGIIDNLQEDRADARAIKAELRVELKTCAANVLVITAERDEYRRRYGPLENDAPTPT